MLTAALILTAAFVAAPQAYGSCATEAMVSPMISNWRSNADRSTACRVTPSWPSDWDVAHAPGGTGIPRTEKPPSHSITTPVVAAALAREASWT
jgi:hypothetical protein